MKFKTKLKQIGAFTSRNVAVFFKDKGTVISALIAPLVLILLYTLFLHSVLKDSFLSGMGDFAVEDSLVNGFIAAYEIASIMGVSSVTVAFVANMAMVDDRLTGARNDLTVSPVPSYVIALGYYFATAIVTLAICLITLGAGFIYCACMGWGMTAGDAALVFLDTFLAVMFGTAFSSVVCYFLKSRGAETAVSTIVSTVYGFISGAYYPIAQFGKGIANFVMCLPGTYCTGLFRTHIMGGFWDKFIDAGFPPQAADNIFDSLDGRMYFFDNLVPVGNMYIVVICCTLAIVGIFVLLNLLRKKSKNRAQNTKKALTE